MSSLFAAGPRAFLLSTTLLLVTCAPTSSNIAGGAGAGDGTPPQNTGTIAGGGGGGGGAASGYYLTANGNTLVDNSGNPVTLHGVTWYGFDSNSTLVGTNEGTDRLAGDFATAIYRLQLLGFNTVRLPFTFATALDANTALTTLGQACTVDSNTQIATATTDPIVTPAPAVSTMPGMVRPPVFSNGLCNSYIAYQSPAQRFAYAVQLLTANNFYVILADRENSGSLYDPNQGGTQWNKLLTSLNLTGDSAGWVMLDLVDEPDRVGLGWDQLTDYYTNTMTAVTASYPHSLFLIEGGGQQASGANPGDGFVTNEQQISSLGLSDPNVFFARVLAASYKSQVVLAPHIYPPSISGKSADTGTTLWTRLSNSFGILTQKGDSPYPTLFPVIIGGFGSGIDGTGDLQMLVDLSAYMTLGTVQANDGRHAALTSWVWLSYYQTGPTSVGLVNDSNYIGVRWNQIEYLEGYSPPTQSPAFQYSLGLKPWY